MAAHDATGDWTVTPTLCGADSNMLDFADASGHIVRIVIVNPREPFVRIAGGGHEIAFAAKECRVAQYSMVDWGNRTGRHSYEKTAAAGAQIECRSELGSIVGTVIARGCAAR
jgi:hypothetical protein